MYAIDQIGTPSILKTRRFGYDGKGQLKLESFSQAEDALKDSRAKDLILEGFVNFSREFFCNWIAIKRWANIML